MHLREFMETNNKNIETGYVYVSTTETFDNDLETMVFMCNSDGVVSDWSGVDCDYYTSVEEAEYGHKMMLAKWGKLAVFN